MRPLASMPMKDRDKLFPKTSKNPPIDCSGCLMSGSGNGDVQKEADCSKLVPGKMPSMAEQRSTSYVLPYLWRLQIVSCSNMATTPTTAVKTNRSRNVHMNKAKSPVTIRMNQSVGLVGSLPPGKRRCMSLMSPQNACKRHLGRLLGSICILLRQDSCRSSLILKGEQRLNSQGIVNNSS